MIRIFTNDFGVCAMAVPEKDLYSFSVSTEQIEYARVSLLIAHQKSLVPDGYRCIGFLKEKHQITFRYLRNGVNPIDLKLPENMDELEFKFD